MQDPRFRQNDEAVAGALFGVIQQLAGGSNEIRQVQQILLALGVGDHFSPGMFVLEGQHSFFAEGLVNDAASRPEGQLATALLLNPAPQVLIGCEQNGLIGRQLVHQINGIAAGADQIALRLHCGRAVDVAHHEVVGVLCPKAGELIGGAVVRQGASGL